MLNPQNKNKSCSIGPAVIDGGEPRAEERASGNRPGPFVHPEDYRGLPARGVARQASLSFPSLVIA